MCIIDNVKMNDECTQYICIYIYICVCVYVHICYIFRIQHRNCRCRCPRHPRRLQTPRRKSPHISMDWQAKHLGISMGGQLKKKARLIAVDGVYLAAYWRKLPSANR